MEHLFEENLDTFTLLVLLRKHEIMLEVNIKSGAFEQFLVIEAAEDCYKSEIKFCSGKAV